MLLYSILMFIVSVPLTVLSVMVYRGKTDLIHSYHQEKVKDKAAYGKAFGKALSFIALAPFASGVIGSFAHAKPLKSNGCFGSVFWLCCGALLYFGRTKKIQ